MVIGPDNQLGSNYNLHECAVIPQSSSKDSFIPFQQGFQIFARREAPAVDNALRIGAAAGAVLLGLRCPEEGSGE